MRRLLLGSGGIRTEERQASMRKLMREHFGDIEEILFVPYAIADHDGYVEKLIELDFNAGYGLRGIHTFDDPAQAVENAEGVYVGGGNTFRLTHDLQRFGLIEPIRNRVLAGEVPYMGVSAGTNVACPTMMTTNDMPIVQPASFDTLNLVPFQVNAHYYSGEMHIRLANGSMIRHCGETRDDRLREFHEMNDTPVIGLWEGGYLVIEGNMMTLEGGRAHVFQKGSAPVMVDPGTRMRVSLDVAAATA